jgi:p-hydroxybenzoate 3-monooxygenase
MRTQVGIIGAGPAGLTLSLLLNRLGIETVILESRSRQYVEARIRAGVIEHWATELFDELGVGARLRKQGLVHEGIEIRVNGIGRRIDFKQLVNKTITVYGQHEVVKDLIQARLAQGGAIEFEVSDTQVDRLDSEQPIIRFKKNGESHEIACDFIAGCDGFHGVCRPSVPKGVLTEFERVYPFGWLGILAESPPVNHELIYNNHDRGFSLYAMRAPTITRAYLQCDPDEDAKNWSDEEIWAELKRRLGPEGETRLKTGRIIEKGVTAMRSFVTEPMQFGRLFLAGDAAHIVPPTGAKGMNLAIADVLFFSRALEAFYKSKSTTLLDGYTKKCLNRIWKAQRFSYFMTTMLHLNPNDGPFDRRRQLAELDYVTSSKAASAALAENYVGLPID